MRKVVVARFSTVLLSPRAETFCLVEAALGLTARRRVCVSFLCVSLLVARAVQSSILPLLFVLFVTALKEAFEDLKRRRSDREINGMLACVVSEVPGAVKDGTINAGDDDVVGAKGVVAVLSLNRL